MKTVIVSDVHLGCEHCRCERFIRFLDALPADANLVLNGDTVDGWRRAWSDEHQRAIDRLRDESLRRSVVWVRGNHDDDFEVADPGHIVFCKSHAIGKRLYITHGHRAVRSIFSHPLILLPFRLLYRLRARLGGEPIHIAHYANKFPRFYRVLCNNVAVNAVAHAKAHGFEAVTCGHSHHAEDTHMGDIRYINTGAWTGDQLHSLNVDDDQMSLDVVEQAPGGKM